MGAAEALAIWAIPHAAVALGGDHILIAIAALLEPAPDDLLANTTGIPRHPARVDVGRVDEITAGSRVGVHNAKCGRLVRCPAELHRAEADRRDLQSRAAECPIF